MILLFSSILWAADVDIAPEDVAGIDAAITLLRPGDTLRFTGGTYDVWNWSFTINGDGNIESNGALDYSTQHTYVFTLSYTEAAASGSDTFVDTITVTLNDTLSSTATVIAEETELLTIAASEFSDTIFSSPTKSLYWNAWVIPANAEGTPAGSKPDK